jgi:hypothetical protein
VVSQALELVVLDALREMSNSIQGCDFSGDIDSTVSVKSGRYRVLKKLEPPSRLSGRVKKWVIFILFYLAQEHSLLNVKTSVNGFILMRQK